VTPPRPTRVLVADDHSLVRAGLIEILRREGFEVAAEVEDGETALEKTLALAPAVAVLDVAMPRMTGIEVARKLRDAGCGTAVVLLSMHKAPSIVRESLLAGASAYVCKHADPEEFVAAVRAAAAGGLHLGAGIGRGVLSSLGGGAPVDAGLLSPRERDVVRLLARGLSNKEMAAALGIGVRTVDTHRSSVMDKLGIRHVAGLVKWAIMNQLATLEE
jgi:DNA-binding NarL/FixJ family response regulator